MGLRFPDLDQVRRQLQGRLPVTRFAPSPTGYLHLGHVINAIYVWGLARALDGEVILRLEDHDRQRSRPEYEAAILEDLTWLGLHPDRGHPDAFAQSTRYRQSDNDPQYTEHLNALRTRTHLYACDCSRRRLSARATPNENGELPYDGFCRERGLAEDGAVGLRVQLPDEQVRFVDLMVGECVHRPAHQCGDLLVRDRNQQWTYQFSVVQDDLDMGVNLIIRGQDILSSTGRQLLLARRRDPAFNPVFVHHPLLMREDGRKLSKRFGDKDIHAEKLAGTDPEWILGQAAHQLGLIPILRPLPAEEIPHLFRTRSPASPDQ
ncbi:MAG: glutamate--tRNA ligase family protein [Bacteroidota bacterium]